MRVWKREFQFSALFQVARKTLHVAAPVGSIFSLLLKHGSFRYIKTLTRYLFLKNLFRPHAIVKL